MKKVRWILFVVSSICMLSFPIYQIIRYEAVMTGGDEHLFRCKPVDPYNPFSGRYVSIAFKDDVFTDENGFSGYHQRGWCIVEKSADGFTRFVKFSKKKPLQGTYMDCTVSIHNKKKNEVRVTPVIDRYYLNEYVAPVAEKSYERATRASSEEVCYLKVKIKDGKAVPVGLVVGHQRW